MSVCPGWAVCLSSGQSHVPCSGWKVPPEREGLNILASGEGKSSGGIGRRELREDRSLRKTGRSREERCTNKLS